MTAPVDSASPEEKIVWQGTSSQVIHLHIYILCGLFCWLVVPIFIALWKWILVRSRTYEVTTQRLRIRQGVFSKRTDEMELYRVKDTTLVEPFWPRLFGLGTIEMTTNDATTPLIRIEAIAGAKELREQLRQHIEACRDRKRVRLAELE